jgi:3-phenylpropionate/cinnamic acid dioxygenase small subunit
MIGELSAMGTELERWFEISQLLYREARMLDEGRFEDWLAWLSPSIRYWMPLRFVRRANEREKEFTSMDDQIAYLDEDFDSMEMRVKKIRHRMSWSDNPMSRTVHAITNVEVMSYDDRACNVRSIATVHRSRFAHYEDQWIVQRDDTLEKADGDWKLRERKVYYPCAVLESSNLSIFF